MHRYPESIFLVTINIMFATYTIRVYNRGMQNIPLTKRAQLTAQMAVKMEPALDQEVRVLKAHGVDVPELVRQFLRTEVPKIKKKLGA